VATASSDDYIRGLASRMLLHTAMERYFFSSVGILFLGTLGAFFLFVPIMSIAIVTLILIGLALMFVLGWQAGRRRLRGMFRHTACTSNLAGHEPAIKSNKEYQVL
jgi:hypothetical protein